MFQKSKKKNVLENLMQGDSDFNFKTWKNILDRNISAEVKSFTVNKA